MPMLSERVAIIPMRWGGLPPSDPHLSQAGRRRNRSPQSARSRRGSRRGVPLDHDAE
jgi:hypothetical protein